MTHQEIREKFREFFKARGHKWVASSSLLPTDPSVLFTTAGMQQFKPYYTGQADAMKDFGSLNTASVQKSMRTSDIDEVGDESHLTFFEMLGNFSFGGYWKKKAIEWAHEFITKEMGLKIDYVSVFGGEEVVMLGGKGFLKPDKESEEVWKEIDPNIVVKKFGSADNFWGPTGNEGPCGPTTEIYVNGIEIWNLVFNEYYCHSDKKLTLLDIQGIDTGMGLERLAMVVQKKENIFETDLFEPILKELPTSWTDIRVKRILTDHVRAICFLIADGVRPSNKEQGYVLRKLIRRSVVNIKYKQTTSFQGLDTLPMGVEEDLSKLFRTVIKNYKNAYPNLDENTILSVFDEERKKFAPILENGLRELDKFLIEEGKNIWIRGFSNIFLGRAYDNKNLAKKLFDIKQNQGLDFDVMYVILENRRDFKFDLPILKEEIAKQALLHQEISRAGAEKKFGGHGLLMDTGELKAGNEEELRKATRLHTATHLLHTSLRKILGNEVHQAGSDITAERLRFDFTFPRKLTSEEIKQVEDMVNEAIAKDYQVTKEEMPYEDAIKSGALAFFKLKYPPKVNVYSVGDFSKELCGGPHVSHTAEIGRFKITKEEAVSAGVRRIRAVVE